MSSKSKDSPPAGPTPEMLIVVKTVIGALLSFGFGRTPGTVPDNLLLELCPSIIVICGFLVTYSLYDVMAVGLVKHKYKLFDIKDFNKEYPTRLPEEIFLAERTQMNQLEQLPVFLVGTLAFSTLVNGHVGAIMAFVWVVLRRLYAKRYRNSVGVPFKDKNLTAFTIPCYFIVNTLLLGSAVHAIRWMVA